MTFSHRIAAAALSVACLSASSWASVVFTLDNGNSYNVEYVAGSSTGDSKAILEIAFSPSQYVLFGYQWQWDSTKNVSASDMVLAIDAAAKDAVTGESIGTTDQLNVTAENYSFGVYFTGFAYKSLSADTNWDKLLWWGYSTSEDGANWTFSNYNGPSDNLLTNGIFQGFAYGTGDVILPTSVAAVPEPASLGILIIGLLMKYRRR